MENEAVTCPKNWAEADGEILGLLAHLRSRWEARGGLWRNQRDGGIMLHYRRHDDPTKFFRFAVIERNLLLAVNPIAQQMKDVGSLETGLYYMYGVASLLNDVHVETYGRFDNLDQWSILTKGTNQMPAAKPLLLKQDYWLELIDGTLMRYRGQ